jgi:hypothetical protein
VAARLSPRAAYACPFIARRSRIVTCLSLKRMHTNTRALLRRLPIVVCYQGAHTNVCILLRGYVSLPVVTKKGRTRLLACCWGCYASLFVCLLPKDTYDFTCVVRGVARSCPLVTERGAKYGCLHISRWLRIFTCMLLKRAHTTTYAHRCQGGYASLFVAKRGARYGCLYVSRKLRIFTCVLLKRAHTTTHRC